MFVSESGLSGKGISGINRGRLVPSLKDYWDVWRSSLDRSSVDRQCTMLNVDGTTMENSKEFAEALK